MLHFIRTYWKSLGWIGFILYGTLTPNEGLPNFGLFEIEYMDLVIHFFLFFIMYSLILIDINFFSFHFNAPSKIRFGVVLCVLIGLLTETVQHFFIPSRSGNVFDFIFNSLGVFASLYIFSKLQKAIAKNLPFINKLP